MSDRCRKCAALLVFSAEECSDAAACAARTHSAQTAAALRDQLEAVTRERDEARADAARLREALTQVRDAMRATGQEPDGDDDPRRPVASAVWHALDSTPSAEPTPRDMRVAEAVWCSAKCLDEDEVGVVEREHLAAVVAKAVKS